MEKRLIELKKEIKKHKPDFVRQDAHKKVRLSSGWRRPKGHHSKMREKRKGHRVFVDVGYRTPRMLRNKIEGKDVVLVHNVNELKKIDIKSQSIIIANIGIKKKIEIAKECKKMKIEPLNLSLNKFLKKIEERVAKPKEEEKEKREIKEKKKEEISAEEKEKREKEEKDKIITKAR